MPNEISFNEALMSLAAEYRKEVSFRYLKDPAGSIEYRTLVPEAVHVKDGVARFTGLDADRKGYRSFRIDRMRGEVAVR